MALWNQTTAEEGSDKPSSAPVPPPQATAIPVAKDPSAKGNRESVFGPGVTIEGKIEGSSDVRIGGSFKGEIQITGDLNVEKGARLGAKVHATNITLGGELEGNVVASGQVRLTESGQMIGDLKASTLTVAAGSRMRGHVEFGWSAAESAKFLNGQAHEHEKNRKGG
jgi:cytoskeletal protein CcmA (bactofilin family)